MIIEYPAKINASASLSNHKDTTSRTVMRETLCRKRSSGCPVSENFGFPDSLPAIALDFVI